MNVEQMVIIAQFIVILVLLGMVFGFANAAKDLYPAEFVDKLLAKAQEAAFKTPTTSDDIMVEIAKHLNAVTDKLLGTSDEAQKPD